MQGVVAEVEAVELRSEQLITGSKHRSWRNQGRASAVRLEIAI